MKTLLTIALLMFGNLAYADGTIAKPALLVIPDSGSEKAQSQEECLNDQIQALYSAGAFGQFALFSLSITGPFRGDQIGLGRDPTAALYLGSIHLATHDGFSNDFMISVTLKTAQNEQWQNVRDPAGNLELKASQVLTAAVLTDRNGRKTYPLSLASCSEVFRQ